MDKLLTIFAHQDDETFSSGGTLAKHAKISKSYSLSVTNDPKRKKEFFDACSILNVEPILQDNSIITQANSREIRNLLIEKIREIQPDHIITHLDYDYHEEHRIINTTVKEAVEWVSHTTSDKNAFLVTNVWAAETTILIPFPEIYIDITEENAMRLEAIKCYESQNKKGGSGFYSKFHNTRTHLRGIQADVEHAEVYITVPIALTGSFKPVKVLEKLPKLILS
jgi:LmbE family N-acetylglucosaminyl deacetylase